MNVPRLSRLASRVAFVVIALATACGSPFWRSDGYVVEGTLTGTTCQMTVDGHQVTAKSALFDEKVFIHRQSAQGSSFPENHDQTSISCLAVHLTLLSPAGSLPTAGRYRLVAGEVGESPGIAIMSVEYKGVRPGPWPFALTGVHLEPKDGVLQLDELTATTARGVFRAVMRRQPNGE